MNQDSPPLFSLRVSDKQKPHILQVFQFSQAIDSQPTNQKSKDIIWNLKIKDTSAYK